MSRPIHVEVYRTRRPIGRQRWRFRVVSDNGEKLAQGEAYSNREDAITTAMLVVGPKVIVDAPTG